MHKKRRKIRIHVVFITVLFIIITAIILLYLSIYLSLPRISDDYDFRATHRTLVEEVYKYRIDNGDFPKNISVLENYLGTLCLWNDDSKDTSHKFSIDKNGNLVLNSKYKKNIFTKEEKITHIFE